MRLERLRTPGLWLSLAFVVAYGALGLAHDDLSKKRAASPHGKLVFVLATGIEDSEVMTCALRDAKLAKMSGFLEEVDLLVCGRGAYALADRPSVATRSSRTAALAREAREAGVRIFVDAESIRSLGIAKEALDPTPDEVVDSGAEKLAELASLDFHVIRY